MKLTIFEYLNQRLEDEGVGLKLSISLGYILYNNTTGETLYFDPSTQTRIINSAVDVDILTPEYVTNFISRPSTKWSLLLIADYLFVIYRLRRLIEKEYGCIETEIPEYIKKQSFMYVLNRHKDNYCLLRCLGIFIGKVRYDNTCIKEMRFMYKILMGQEVNEECFKRHWL